MRGRPVKRRKRGSGEGSIYKAKRGDITYYLVRVTLPDGTRTPQKYFRSLEDAQEALLKMRAEIASGVLPSDMTFEEWAEHWVGTKSDLKQKTFDQYKRNLLYASTIFGKKKLDKVRAHDLEAMLRSNHDKGHSPNTLRKLHTIVSSCLRAAYKRGLIVRDIAEQVDAPRAKKRDVVVLSRDQWNILTDASRHSDRELIVEFVLKTGMRINEALSMTWERFDAVSGHVTVGESKTEAGSYRSIPVDKGLLERLISLRSNHFERQLQERGWNPSDLIFCTSKGTRNDYRNLQKRVPTPLLKEADLPHLTWHHLRHNAGSYLLSENVPITLVSKYLGHANPTITMAIYAHELSEDMELVRVAMAKIG